MLQKCYFKSPIGYFEIKGTPKGIQSVKRVDEKGKNSPDLHDVMLDCQEQLQEYFDKKRSSFEIKIDWEDATPFNVSVWEALLKIPYGHTRSYSYIADEIENPAAVRAVGLANKHNPIAIIVPCHRVIGKNGDLTGYFYGLDVKRKLLELENPMSFAEQGSLF